MEKLKKILISPKISINQALKQMDESAEKILFVIDARNRLLGTVTDGDIRRWILKGRSLNAAITRAMNKSPLFLKEAHTQDEAKRLMFSKRIECLPVLNEKKEVVLARWWLDFFDGESKKIKKINIPVVIMAGGKGSRLSPFTKVLPKPLIPIGEKPIIEQIMERFTRYGCRQFYLSLNYRSNIIKAYFNDFVSNSDISIKYLQEKQPLGTAGSLSLLRKVNSAFFVTNCDILIEADYAEILQFHKSNKNKLTLVVCTKHYTIPYGICEIFNGGSLKAVREKPSYELLVNTGFYVLGPEVLRDIPKNRVYHMTDLINSCLKKGKKIGVYPVSEKSWLDIGQWEELQETMKRFGV